MIMPDEPTIVIEAVRCCCAARRRGACDLMPYIFRMLDRYGCGMLTLPVLGLVQASEACLRRRLVTGDDTLSDDECGLLTLLDEPEAAPSVFGLPADVRAMTEVLACAALCARIMIRMELGRYSGWEVQAPLRAMAHR